MKRFIDIHTHILPEVDDGAESYTVALEMLDCAQMAGTKEIIFTPHYYPGKEYTDIDNQNKMYGIFTNNLNKIPNIRIYQGNELYYSIGCEELLNKKIVHTLADSKYVLIEFPIDAEFDYIETAVRRLQMEGYYVILAHIERYQCLMKMKFVEELINQGAYIQVNATAVGGKFGCKHNCKIKKLLEYEFVQFIASDAHDVIKRSPDMSDAWKWLCKHYGERYAEQLMYDNQQYILNNEKL